MLYDRITTHQRKYPRNTHSLPLVVLFRWQRNFRTSTGSTSRYNHCLISHALDSPNRWHDIKHYKYNSFEFLSGIRCQSLTSSDLNTSTFPATGTNNCTTRTVSGPAASNGMEECCSAAFDRFIVDE